MVANTRPNHDNVTKPFSVGLWGSHPDDDNDDQWMGQDFADEASARRVFDDPSTSDSPCFVAQAAKRCSVFIEITRRIDDKNVQILDVRRLREDLPPDPLDDDGCNEHAMQQGMLGGVEAYNAAMGWHVEDGDERYDA